MQRLTLFQNTNEPSPPLDPAFLAFSIPSAENLYHEIISRDEYELVSQLSLNEIKKILSDKGCDIADFAKDPEIKILFETHYHYIFHFGKMDFDAREKCITALNELRSVEVDKDNLFLDKSGLKLHFSHTESWCFDAEDTSDEEDSADKEERKSLLPHAYCARYYYDRIVEELYQHNLKRKDKDYKNSLISDYLSIHEKAGVHNPIEKCLRNICDRKAAASLRWAGESFMLSRTPYARGAIGMLPLTASAFAYTEPGKDCLGQNCSRNLNQYSHHYFSLVQYRYLMDLKCLFSDVDAYEIQRIKDHMKKWEDFKYQPIIAKYEALMNKLEDIRSQDRALGVWTDCYWEEQISENGEVVILIGAFHGQEDSESFSQRFLDRVCVELNGPLKMTIYNNFHSVEFRYYNAFFLSVTQKDLAAYPIKDLLAYSENGIQKSTNAALTRLTLSNQTFFQTKKPREWVQCLENASRYNSELSSCREELKQFIWMQVAWLMIKDWVYHYEEIVLPAEVLLSIPSLLGRVLKQEEDDLAKKRPPILVVHYNGYK
jgi:hypothetical protein